MATCEAVPEAVDAGPHPPAGADLRARTRTEREMFLLAASTAPRSAPRSTR